MYYFIEGFDEFLLFLHPGRSVFPLSELPACISYKKGCDFSALLWLASVLHRHHHCSFIRRKRHRPIVVAEKFVVFLLVLLYSAQPPSFIGSLHLNGHKESLTYWTFGVTTFSLFKFICRILCTITFRHQIVPVGWMSGSESHQCLCNKLTTWIMLSCCNFNDAGCF